MIYFVEVYQLSKISWNSVSVNKIVVHLHAQRGAAQEMCEHSAVPEESQGIC